MSRSRYSQEDKAGAVALFAEHGLAAAFHQTGIPKTSIARWAKTAGVVTYHAEKTAAAIAAREVRIAAKRSEIRERMLDEAIYCLDAIHNEHIDFKSAGPSGPAKVIFPVAPAAAVQHYATSLAVFIDKFRLESGEVTSRDEHHNIGQSELDREIDTLMAEMARREEVGPTESAEGEAGLVPVDTPLPVPEAAEVPGA